ncbi:hypothetical protein EE612_047528, partial [Oryza sativa]
PALLLSLRSLSCPSNGRPQFSSSRR